MKKRIFSTALLSLSILAFSCKKDDPVHEHENENINQVQLTFHNENTHKTFLWTLDQIDTILLDENQTYELSIAFLHADQDKTEDLTSEIQEEAENHQIVYSIEPSSLASITYLDKDVNNLPIGLESEIKISDAGNGKFRVVLKHFNDSKNIPSSGSTDVDIQFPIVIQ